MPAMASGCAVSPAAAGFRDSPLAAASEAPLGRLLSWLEAVAAHTPGCGDRPADAIARLSTTGLEMLLRDVGELVTFLARVYTSADAAEQRGRAVFSLHGRRFTLDELERVFFHGRTLAPNAMLTRAAVFHADIAVLFPGGLSGEPLVADGGRKGWRTGTLHWEIARQLLDRLTPAPSGDAGALLWYRAVSAHLLSGGHLAEAMAHLTKARQVFPREAAFLMDSARLHELFSSPALQASAEVLRRDGIDVKVESRRAELQHAARFLRLALARAPDAAEARLRLAHTLTELGNHKDAAAELSALERRQNGALSRRQLYLSELFMGRAQQMLGSRGEAERHFRNAAALYPGAQSPRFALSSLARLSGNQVEAVRALLLASPPVDDESGERDPWFDYYHPRADEAEALMRELRASAER